MMNERDLRNFEPIDVQSLSEGTFAIDGRPRHFAFVRCDAACVCFAVLVRTTVIHPFLLKSS